MKSVWGVVVVVMVIEAGRPKDGRLASFRFKEWMPVSAEWERGAVLISGCSMYDVVQGPRLFVRERSDV